MIWLASLTLFRHAIIPAAARLRHADDILMLRYRLR